MNTNPFSTRWVCPGALEYRYPDQIDGDRVADSICDCLRQHRRGCIIGPHGSGKTTLLHSLRPALKSRFDQVETVQICEAGSLRLAGRIKHSRSCWRVIHQLVARLRQKSTHCLLIVDGLEQLLPLHRWRLAWTARTSGPTLLATAHAALTAWPVVFETSCDRQRVVALTETLLEHATPQVASMVRTRLARHDWTGGTNVRDLWFDCYDDVQSHLLESIESPAAATQHSDR